jgi:zinc finger protein BrlA
MEDLSSLDTTALPSDNLGHQEHTFISDYLQTYEEDNLKSFKPEIDFFYQTPIPQYNQSASNHSCSQQPDYLLDSTSSFRPFRPNFCQLEQMPNTVSTSDMLPGMLLNEPIAPQTVTPAQAFPFAAIAPLPFSCLEFGPRIANSKMQTSLIPMHPFEIPFGTDTPFSLLSEERPACDKKKHLAPVDSEVSPRQQHRQVFGGQPSTQPADSNLSQENVHSIIKQSQFKCKTPKCNRSFKRQEHLQRHMKSHSNGKRYACWVPGCNRAFSRCDNLSAHYTKTHSKPGGRNRYVSSLDKTSPDYNPDFRGQLTSDGRPLYQQA